METSGSSAGKDSLGNETCWMAANTENSPCERRQRRRKLGAWLGEDGWVQEKVVRGAGWGEEGPGEQEGMREGEQGLQEKTSMCEKQAVRSLSETKRCSQGGEGEEDKGKKKVLKVTARGLAQPSVLPDGDRVTAT